MGGVETFGQGLGAPKPRHFFLPRLCLMLSESWGLCMPHDGGILEQFLKLSIETLIADGEEIATTSSLWRIRRS